MAAQNTYFPDAAGATYADLGDPEWAANAAVEEAQASGANEATVAELQAEADVISGQRNSLFNGETLRGLLLPTFAWSTIGRIAGIAASPTNRPTIVGSTPSTPSSRPTRSTPGRCASSACRSSSAWPASSASDRRYELPTSLGDARPRRPRTRHLRVPLPDPGPRRLRHDDHTLVIDDTLTADDLASDAATMTMTPAGHAA